MPSEKGTLLICNANGILRGMKYFLPTSKKFSQFWGGGFAASPRSVHWRQFMRGYENMYDFRNLYNAHLAARRGKRDKAEIIRFEMNLSQNLCNLQQSLQYKTYHPQGYKHFFVYDPKVRSIYAPSYSDRVVQHCLCDNILMPALEPRLIHDNAACRVNKGTHFSIYRLSGYMREFYRKHGTSGFFLKCDVRKYFESIDHVVLKNKLHKIFGEGDTFSLLCRIIDSYEKSPGKGLPLGNQASQWFALLYLDVMDRLIKEKLQIKYYVRYMDDFILLHHDKVYLQKCLTEIQSLFSEVLQLELNEKTQIFPIKNGVNYLGWRFCISETGKVIRRLKTANKKRTKRRFKQLRKDYSEGIASLRDIGRSLASIHGHLIHGHTYRLRKKLWGEMVLSPPSG